MDSKLRIILPSLNFVSNFDQQNKDRTPKAELASLKPNYKANFSSDLDTSNAADEGDKYQNDANATCKLSEHRY